MFIWRYSEARVDIKSKDREKRVNKAIRDKKIRRWIMIALVVAVVAGIGFAVATSRAPLVTALAIDGIQCNNVEQLVFHNHVHLDILVDGQAYTIPPQIGILLGKCFYWLHTHDESGTIHIESPLAKDYTLGEFFDIWNKTKPGTTPLFSKNANNNQNGNLPIVYINGSKLNEGVDYRNIKLVNHNEITLVYGKPPASNSIPSKYNFPQGS